MNAGAVVAGSYPAEPIWQPSNICPPPQPPEIMHPPISIPHIYPKELAFLYPDKKSPKHANKKDQYIPNVPISHHQSLSSISVPAPFQHLNQQINLSICSFLWNNLS